MTQISNDIPTVPILVILGGLILLRILVGFHPHSGQGNDHDGKAAYGGDFEAQRHWMEITLHLPISSWYHYELDYWGLDYPILTAYHSYFCGWLCEKLVGEESIALDTSWGYEDPTHKAFMRATVLLFDIIVYFSAVWFVCGILNRHNNRASRTWSAVLSLSQPSLILIDHGHFQYNTIAIGLALWSFYFMALSNGSFDKCIIGSVFFCMSLNFKQMTLYYAPAVFSYLLGRCFIKEKFSVRRFLTLGTTVILCFAVLWYPYFAASCKDHELTLIEAILHVLRRIFPFSRGLFENKVANIWCALSVKPIQIRKRIPETIQPHVALILTLILILPSCISLFQLGRRLNVKYSKNHLRLLLRGSGTVALGFFLGSFQVHEKSILMAVAPLSLLIIEDVRFLGGYFSLVSAWSLWPLLKIDRLQLAYWACIIIYLCLLDYLSMGMRHAGTTRNHKTLIMRINRAIVIPASRILMIGLHIAEFVIKVPQNLPDLFAVLWSIVGCGFFCWAWLYCSWTMVAVRPLKDDKSKKS